jgi:hypothetical protein
MKKFDKALAEIAKRVKAEMTDRISQHCDTMSFEYDFGNTTIMIEVSECGSFLMRYDMVDVWIERDDCEHNSPLVIQAIKNVLPDWWQIKQEVEQQEREMELNERFIRANYSTYL